MNTLFLALGTVIVTMVTGAPVTNLNQAKEFLIKYVYMGEEHPDESMHNENLEDTLRRAILHYQANMGINQTGVLDEETMRWMSKPRCGVKDVTNKRDIMRRRRYAIQGTRWGISPLTYRFNSYTPDLSKSDVERIIAQALKMWSDAASLRFVKVSSGQPAVIEIEFLAGEHGDENPFDGPSGTLAHAFFPTQNPIGGDAHFDEAETFTDRTNDGINLLFVAVHEFGHSLGLGHSDVQDAIMFPTYLGYHPDLRLHDDDIAGITALYGPATTTTTTTTTAAPLSPGAPTEAPPREGFCRNGSVDAIGRLRGHIYAFQGSSYVRLDPTLGIVVGHPRAIASDWPQLQGSVDAILDSPDESYIQIFKGSMVWRYTQSPSGLFELTPQYPKGISSAITGLPNDIDLAFVWGDNGRSYIFKGDQYYRLNPANNAVTGGIPRPVSLWGLPSDTYTAAFQAQNRRTYFFADTQYYRYNDLELQVDVGYPQVTRERWFRCTGSTMEMDENPDQIPQVTPRVSSASEISASVGVFIIGVLSLML